MNLLVVVPNKLSSTVRVYETAAIQVSGTLDGVNRKKIQIDFPSIPEWYMYDLICLNFSDRQFTSLNPNPSISDDVTLYLGNINNNVGYNLLQSNKYDVSKVILQRTNINLYNYIEYEKRFYRVSHTNEGDYVNVANQVKSSQFGIFLDKLSGEYTYNNQLTIECFKLEY